MKEVKYNANYQLKVGDLIIAKHPAFGISKYLITRETAKFVYSHVTDDYEAKFPKTYNIHFQVLPRDTWSQITYTIYSP